MTTATSRIRTIGTAADDVTAAVARTIDDVISLLQSHARILVVTGAGISVSCGVPDFRSKQGLYTALRGSRIPALDGVSEAEELFDISLFRADPAPFYAVARVLYDVAPVLGGTPVATRRPSLAHRFIAALDARGVLLRNVTQNIDGLEAAAGVSRVLACHGTLATASCLRCGHRVTASALLPAIEAGDVARCAQRRCERRRDAVLKPDVTFFREELPAGVAKALPTDAGAADLLLVIGSSMRVAPVAEVPRMLQPGTPAVLINAEPLGGRGSGGAGAAAIRFDVELIGDADVICRYLWNRLGWPGWPPIDGDDADGSETASSGAAVDDTVVAEDAARPGRFLFSSASQSAAHAVRSAALAARLDLCLHACEQRGARHVADAPACMVDVDTALPVTRSGRVVRPRREDG